MDILLKIKKEYPICKKETSFLRYNCRELRKNLSPSDKKLLLRIIDGKDLLIETAAYQNFEHGFYMGIQLASKILQK